MSAYKKYFLATPSANAGSVVLSTGQAVVSPKGKVLGYVT